MAQRFLDDRLCHVEMPDERVFDLLAEQPVGRKEEIQQATGSGGFAGNAGAGEAHLARYGGDVLVRTALYEAAHVMLTRAVRFSTSKRWAMAVAKRRGMKRAKVALARKLAVVMHAMWRDGTAFRWGKEPKIAVA